METGLARNIDLVKESLSYLLTLQFAKSSSQSYRLAVNVAEGANKYQEIKIGNHTIHTVVFDKTREDAARAVSLLQYVSDWKSTLVYGGGKLLQDRFRISQILRCYLEAAACDDWKAHCYQVIDDPFAETMDYSGQGMSIVITNEPFKMSQEVLIDEYIFPCSFLKSFLRRMNQKHPSDPVHQIQAVAITIGCDLCPYFGANAYKKVGQRTKFY